MKKYDVTMMKTAYLWASESSCNRKKVGAVLTLNGRVLSNGYNGTVSGSCNDCEEKCPQCNGVGKVNNNTCSKCQGHGTISKSTVIHAEANALMFALKNGISTDGCTMYVTLQPCIECSKMIIQCGIKEVVFTEEYRITDSIDFLTAHGVLIRKLEI
jgi:dCMP deaminase